MKTKPKYKNPRIKVNPTDLKTFLIESMEIDPFWQDLYYPKEKKVLKKR